MQAVIGPGQIKRRVEPLQRSGNELLAGRRRSRPAALRRGSAHDSERRHRSGVGTAARRASSRPATGPACSRPAPAGRAKGRNRSKAASQRAAERRERAAGALGRLADGSGQAGRRPAHAPSSGRCSLRRRTASDLLPDVRDTGLEQAREPARRTEADGRRRPDPGAGELREAERLVEALAIARNEAQRARQAIAEQAARRPGEAGRRGAHELHGGTDQARRRRRATARAASNGSAAAPSKLVGGLDALRRRRRHARSNARRRVPPLASRCRAGCARASVKVSVSADRFERARSARLRRSSPRDLRLRLLRPLDPATGRRRRSASASGSVVDLENGGQAAQMIVIPRYTFNTAGLDRAERAAARRTPTRLAAAPRAAAPASPAAAAQLIDYTDAISAADPAGDRGDHDRHLPDPGR